MVLCGFGFGIGFNWFCVLFWFVILVVVAYFGCDFRGTDYGLVVLAIAVVVFFVVVVYWHCVCVVCCLCLGAGLLFVGVAVIVARWAECCRLVVCWWCYG